MIKKMTMKAVIYVLGEFSLVIILVAIGFGVKSLIYSDFESNEAKFINHPTKITSPVSGKILYLNNLIETDEIINNNEIILKISTTANKDEINTKNKNNQEIARIKTDLENAKNDIVRYQIAYKDGVVTKKDLEKAEKNLQLAQKRYDDIKKLEISDIQEQQHTASSSNIEEIRAIEDCYATNLKVKVGDSIKEGDELYTQIPKDVIIAIQNNKNRTKKIKTNQKAEAYINNKTYKGTVKSIDDNKMVHILLNKAPFLDNENIKEPFAIKIKTMPVH